MAKIILNFFLIFFSFSSPAKIILGNEQLNEYLPLIKNKRIGLVINHTSLIANTPLLDSLLKLKIDVKKIFSPEHGFKGTKEAGKKFTNLLDKKTKLPIISLYGKTKKPTKSQLEEIDILIFDIQDVGIRFYTYISTLHYVMEAAAENNISVIVLDRPNPNAHYIDGPILNPKFKSFIGMHPIPIVYGMTIGELAKMINQEGWLNNQIKCKLKVIKLKNYTHTTNYDLPINPSPNLTSMYSIYLYPSLGLLEGSKISIGRGTTTPFEIYGHPNLSFGDFFFTPSSNSVAKNPKCKNKKCRGVNLREKPLENIKKEKKINLSYLINSYQNIQNNKDFFKSSFNLLAGNAELKEKIINNLSEKEIRASWIKKISEFKKIRRNYLLYD